ncbi:MAG: YceI family protein [Armatimonadota bacterium]|nr:YceI family protein [Armatimonadota bacterium]MDR7550853.1 YceI family protein [Armatimonadota bacterium]
MQWTFDPSHTSLAFAVKHMGVFTVRGRFGRVSGVAETTEDGRLRTVRATIDAASIDTAEPNRDAHLRSPDFLDAERFPTLTFVSTRIEPRGPSRYRVTGDLTIRDQTRRVTFEAETSGPVTDPWGNRRAGVTATGVLNRKDWDLTWNKILELGTLLVGEEIQFTIDAEATAAAPAAVA